MNQPTMSGGPNECYDPSILPKIATLHKVWVADIPYHYTAIQLGDGPERLYVRYGRTPHQLFGAEFIRDDGNPMPPPAELSGVFTTTGKLFEALRDYCDKRGMPFRFEYVTEDGKTVLGVNPKAL